MTNYFPGGLFIWLLAYLLKQDKPSDPMVEPDAPRYIPEPEPEKQIQYTSNGRVLNDTLFFYYYDMLRLNNIKAVDDQTIVKHADRRYYLINKVDYDVNWPISTRDVNAARVYVLERYYYMTNLN
jgi:hypothetical protein